MDLEKRLVDAFLQNHPEEAAHTLHGLSSSRVAELLQSADPVAAANSLQHALPRVAADALAQMNRDEAAKIMQELPLDAQLVFLHRMDPAVREGLLDALDASAARTLRRLLDYPEGSAGSLMDPAPIAIRSNSSVEEAMKLIRAEAGSVRYYIYVIDDRRQLVGVVTLRQLLQSNRSDSVSLIMESKVASLPAMASARDIIKHPRWNELHALPVVDRDNVLIGVIRYETLGRLKESTSRDQDQQDVMTTLLALSELYWLGMTGSLDAMSVSRDRRPTPTQADEKIDDH